ncbi:MAG: DUF1571 domain-containing protein [Planctomycetaceae bacterium]|nr:DUF1571 domain-containing protein [Planctomycetaceae bacterium]MBQ2822245.1 DUF1571 domain-containing protein [Thermoguttaceae bacterium]
MRFERLGTFCFSGFASFFLFSGIYPLSAQFVDLETESKMPHSVSNTEISTVEEEELSFDDILDAEIFENQQMEETAELLRSEKFEEEIAAEIVAEINEISNHEAQHEIQNESVAGTSIPFDNSVEKTGNAVSDNEKNLQIALASSPMFRSIDGEEPLAAPIRWAKEVIREMESNVRDYSCTISKRERVNGILGKKELISAKIRHEPFSAYLKFEKPRKLAGREVIYVENANDGKLLAHGTGLEALVGTMSLDPESRLAMKGNRYPITNLGILNLAKLLAALGEKNLHEDYVSVRYFNTLLDEKECVCVEVFNPNSKFNSQFHKIQIFVDMKMNLPVKFVSWGWGQNGETPLMEEYSYSNIKLNEGFTDFDFDIKNPEYEFRESQK